MLSEDTLKYLSDFDVFHLVTNFGVFFIVKSVVYQFKEDLLVEQVVLNWDLVVTELCKEFEGSHSQVYVFPVVVFLVVNFIELPFEILSERAHKFFQTSLHIQNWTGW